MSKCSVTTCERPGTQLLVMPEPPNSGLIICTALTIGFNDGDVTLILPGNSLPLCAEHYDALLERLQQASEGDAPYNDQARQICELQEN